MSSSSNTSQEALEQEPLVTPSPQTDSPAAAASSSPPNPNPTNPPRSSTASPNVQPSVAVQQSTPPAAPVPVGHVMVPMPPPAQPVQYVAGQGGMVMMPQIQPQGNVAIDRRLLPEHHMIIVILITMLCAFFNITSLMFGIPALLCSWMAYEDKKKAKYTSTKSYGYAAVVLSIGNILYTGVVTLIIIGLTFGLYCDSSYYHRSRC